jgi:hypothetical protein
MQQNQPDLFDRNEQDISVTRRARARRTDPNTSHEAAASVRDIRGSQQQVLDQLKRFGAMTHEQICGRLPKMSVSGVRSRCNELVKRNLVRNTGSTATTKAGRRTIIWEAV